MSDRYIVLDADVGTEILRFLLSAPEINVPYVRVGQYAQALQTAPALTLEEGQDIRIVNIEPEPSVAELTDTDESKVDGGSVDQTDHEGPDLQVVGETHQALPAAMKEEADGN